MHTGSVAFIRGFDDPILDIAFYDDSLKYIVVTNNTLFHL